MQNIFKLSFFILASAIFLSGCKSTSTSLSSSRLDRPEVNSSPLKMLGKIGLGMRHEVSLLNNTGEMERLIDSEVKVGEPVDYISLGLTVAPKLEISIASHADARLSVKYQFSGDAADTAKKGNFSQAVSLGFAKYDDNGERLIRDQDDGSENVTATFNHDTYSVDAAWIVGYRTTTRGMFYGGPFIVFSNLNGEQIFSRTETNTVPLDSNGYLIGANIAFEYSFDFGLFLTAEYSATKLKWEDDSGSSANLALIVGFEF